MTHAVLRWWARVSSDTSRMGRPCPRGRHLLERRIGLSGWVGSRPGVFGFFFFFFTIPSASNPFLFQAPRHPVSSLFLAHFHCSQEDGQGCVVFRAVSGAGGGRTRPAVSQPNGRATSKKAQSPHGAVEILVRGMAGRRGRGSTVDGRWLSGRGIWRHREREVASPRALGV